MISVLEPVKLSNYQYFAQWFVDACERAGIPRVRNPYIPWKVRQVASKLKLGRTIYRGSPILVPCGGFPDSVAFPVGYFHEIIPVLWDTWPRYHTRIVESFKRNRVRLAFFTQRDVAESISKALPGVKCVWMPEGLNPDGYQKGCALKGRGIDLLELGRLMPRFHAEVVGKIKSHLYKDPKEGLLFPDFQSLTDGLANAKITVSFPRCDTNPEHAGTIETMTQRYWECMLSRTLIIGRAPKELIDFVGYNPCIEVDFSDPAGQVQALLGSIERYQELVDKNYAIAVSHACWDSRMVIVKRYLKDYES